MANESPRQSTERFEVGQLLVWPAPPSVVAPAGELPFAAPSSRGQLVGKMPHGSALVRFHFRNATGGMNWSPALQVAPGQLCSEDIAR